jgi:hypothetical protein
MRARFRGNGWRDIHHLVRGVIYSLRPQQCLEAQGSCALSCLPQNLTKTRVLCRRDSVTPGFACEWRSRPQLGRKKEPHKLVAVRVQERIVRRFTGKTVQMEMCLANTWPSASAERCLEGSQNSDTDYVSRIKFVRRNRYVGFSLEGHSRSMKWCNYDTPAWYYSILGKMMWKWNRHS